MVRDLTSDLFGITKDTEEKFMCLFQVSVFLLYCNVLQVNL